jgi:protein transport protein SEC13
MNSVLSSPARHLMENCPFLRSRVRSPIKCRSPSSLSHVLCHSDDGTWGADIFNGHAIGCNAVSWAPAVLPGSLITPQQPGAPQANPQATTGVKRFASAGCDNLVKIWGFREDTQAWIEEETLEGHTDWVRDVAWAPNIGLPRSYIATASQVRKPFITMSPINSNSIVFPSL